MGITRVFGNAAVGSDVSFFGDGDFAAGSGWGLGALEGSLGATCEADFFSLPFSVSSSPFGDPASYLSFFSTRSSFDSFAAVGREASMSALLNRRWMRKGFRSFEWGTTRARITTWSLSLWGIVI